MSEIIDLTAARNERERPEPHLVHADEYGRPLFTFALEYEFEGGTWSTQLVAYSHEDAVAKVEAMRRSLCVRGQIFAEIVG